MSAFHGMHNGVVKQLEDKIAPFLTRNHFCAHKFNMALKALIELVVLMRCDMEAMKNHAYFKHSPKGTLNSLIWLK